MSEENKNTAGSEESFAEMLEKSTSISERLSPGQRVKTRVIGISGDLVYVDLGGKSDGVIDIAEFTDEKGVCSARVGDEIEASFVTVVDGIRKLTTRIHGYSADSLNAVRDAFDGGVPVRGDVKREVKGGIEVSVGGIRCFCPFSQIDLSGGREGGVYLGQTFSFKVLEFEENGRNIVVSRRAILDVERKAKVEELKKSLSVGDVVTGRVKSVQNFGAFVDLGGIEGLVPASEISWNKGDRPADVLNAGQETTVKVIAIDWDRNRLTLSLKSMKSDPWSGVEQRYSVDGKVIGTIVRLAPFGAFVNLEPGIDGLVHISNLGAGRRVNHPKEVVAVGQQVEAYVLVVDQENRKISLSLQPKQKPREIVYPQTGAIIDGVVDKAAPFGVFVKINESLTGLVPNAEMGTPVGTDHNKMFPSGTPMQVVVIEVDKRQGKVKLSRKRVQEKIEQNEYKEYKNTVRKETENSDGMGLLGKLLKAKMEEKKVSF